MRDGLDERLEVRVPQRAVCEADLSLRLWLLPQPSQRRLEGRRELVLALLLLACTRHGRSGRRRARGAGRGEGRGAWARGGARGGAARGRAPESDPAAGSAGFGCGGGCLAGTVETAMGLGRGTATAGVAFGRRVSATASASGLAFSARTSSCIRSIAASMQRLTAATPCLRMAVATPPLDLQVNSQSRSSSIVALTCGSGRRVVKRRRGGPEHWGQSRAEGGAREGPRGGSRPAASWSPCTPLRPRRRSPPT